jgi:Undecaprenyl-phosphate galactose phosphotransferase WbaP
MEGRTPVSTVLPQGTLLEDEFDGLSATPFGTVSARQTRSAAAPSSEYAIAAEGRSVPDWIAHSIALRRMVLTLLPIVLCDAFALAAAGLLVQLSLARLYPPAAQLVGRGAPFALLLLIAAYWLHDLYSEVWAHPVVEFRQLTHVSTVGLLAAAAGGFLAPPFAVWCLSAWLVVLIMVPLFRNLVRQICSHHRWWGYPTLVIGAGENADAVARILLAVPRSGLRPVLLTDLNRQCRSATVPVVNDPAILDSIVRTQMIRHAVVSLPDVPSSRLADVLDRYSSLLPHLLVLSDITTLPTLWGASRDFGRLSGLEVRNGLLLVTLQIMKRAIDLAVSLTALSLSLPLLLLVAIAIKCTSRGPVLFGHSRIGRNGRSFKAWKFRTMRLDAEKILREYLAANPTAKKEWELDNKLRNDPRVTRLGRRLRQFSLDELPQLWNVLKGDMSIVGPRPIVKAEIARYGDAFRLYATVKPGITGLWQVSGRNDIDYRGRVMLDQFYIRHWSPWLDVYVLAKTIVAVLLRDGAY